VSSSRRPPNRSGKRPARTPARAKAQPLKKRPSPRVRAAAKRTPPAAVAAPPSRPPGTAPKSRPLLRLAGSGSSRLTIKPGPSQGHRTRLELSTKARPGGKRPLSDVELDEDEVLIDAFDAMLGGIKVRITAVLERTCVYVDRDGDRRLARKIDLIVEADKLPIRRRGLV
jgi:hypothetical protein